MNSKDNFEVKEVLKPDNSAWIQISFVNGHHANWRPSFEDLFRIIRPIAKIEDIKYMHGEGKEFVKRFLNEVVMSNKSYEQLAIEFKLPNKEYRKGFYGPKYGRQRRLLNHSFRKPRRPDLKK